MIEAKELGVRLGGKKILRNFSVQMKNGMVTAIIGPNGSGKTTLLSCLTGSRKDYTGTITLKGKSLEKYSIDELALQRAVLSQSIPIDFPFTAQEIVAMGRHQHHFSSKNSEIIAAAMDAVDTLHLKERIFPSLSGGEQQRVQLARVLAQLWDQKNAYLFLDEPTSALDLKHQHQLMNLAVQLAKEKGFAVCIVTHDLHLVQRYANETIIIKNAQIVSSGKTKQVMNIKNICSTFEVHPEWVD